MKRHHCLKKTLVTAGLLLSLVSVPAIAQTTNLRFAHWLPATHPLVKTGFEPWAESLNKATNGSLRFSFFPAQQLGAAGDHHDMARDGIADVTYTNMSYQVGRFPASGAGEIPFLISDAVAASRVYTEWYRQWAPNEVTNAKVCMLFIQPVGAIHSTSQPITHPDHVRGKAMRPPNANIGRLFTSLGASNVQVSAPESREALARGTADGIGFPWDSTYTFGIDQVTRHHLDMPLYVNIFGLIMNQRRYDNMTPAQQAAVDEHCTGEAAARLVAGWNESNEKARQRFIDDPRHQVHEPSAEEAAAWLQSAAPLQQSWAADVRRAGLDADAMWDDLQGRLKAVDALYQ